jgi:beta-glucosidase-like glycosyl hydrolase
MVAAVKSGKISMTRLDDAVRRILYVKKQLGLLAIQFQTLTNTHSLVVKTSKKLLKLQP